MGAVTINFLPKSEITGAITNLTDSNIIDVGGNIGIGTTIPANPLHVAGAVESNSLFIVNLPGTTQTRARLEESSNHGRLRLTNDSGITTIDINSASGTVEATTVTAVDCLATG